MSGLVTVSVEDIIDWSYCPLRVWWNKGGKLTVGSNIKHPITGEQLSRRTIRTAINAFYKAAASGAPVAFSRMVEHAWDRNLVKWGLEDLKPKLIEYADRKRAILDSASKTAAISLNEDGERLIAPSTTRHWTATAISNGLLDLRKSIDRHQNKAGLEVLLLSDDKAFEGPTGLADAYTTCSIIANRLDDNLPSADLFIGAGVPVGVDLLSVRLVVTADLVLRAGTEKTSKEGRPSGREIPREALSYEMHLYDDSPPAYNGFARDIRLMALRQSLPENRSPELSVVKGVSVRLLQTGVTQEFSGLQSADVDILDALAKAFISGQRAGVYIPRMIGGWDACGNCEYRSLCFSNNSDVMREVNPPLVAQIQSSLEVSDNLEELIKDVVSSGDKSVSGIMSRLAEWMKQFPELTVDTVYCMLKSGIERDSGGKV